MWGSVQRGEPDLGLQADQTVGTLGADEVALALSLRGGAVDRQRVPEGGLPQVGQGEGGDPFPVHGGEKIADHIGVFRVVHVIVEIQVAVYDPPLANGLHF